jgi:hypothetical protein
MNELLNIKEDVWDPNKGCIIGRVTRYTDPRRLHVRHDVDGNIVERYKSVSIREMNRPDITSQHKKVDDIGLVSVSPDGLITDYYLFLKEDLVKYIETYRLNKLLAEKSKILSLRYNNNGDYMGVYYGGSYDLLIEKCGETSEFVMRLKEHYVNIPHPLKNAGVILKDFGNEAVYVTYARYITSPEEVWT